MPRKPTKKTLMKKADMLFSRYWREKIGKCENCFSTENLQLAHICTRGIRKLRYDRDNTQILCASCHRHFHNKPLEFAEFVKRTKGEGIYKYLIKASNQLKPIDANYYQTIIEKYETM